MLGVAGFGAALRPFAGKPRSYLSRIGHQPEMCRYPCRDRAIGKTTGYRAAFTCKPTTSALSISAPENAPGSMMYCTSGRRVSQGVAW